MGFLRRSLFRSSLPAGPKKRRAYVIGDIHGRLDLLDTLLARIEDDVRSRPRRSTTLVFLGDLIDRGRDSAGVVERLRTFRPSYAKTVFLAGNHEEVMLSVLAGGEKLFVSWLKFGGAECLRSYGLDPARLNRMPFAQALILLKAAIPQAHVDFLESFADTAGFGSYLFVHAGIRPGVSLEDQEKEDLRWIREPFLDDARDHGFVVVHGHTIRDEIDLCDNRIGIDTGAYRTGVLTALALEGTERWVLQTSEAMIATATTGATRDFSARDERVRDDRVKVGSMGVYQRNLEACVGLQLRRLGIAPLAVAALLAAGCTDTRGGPIPYSVSDFGEPDSTTIAPLAADYKIAPMDTLSVKVFRLPDLSGDYTVDLLGHISMPLIGDVAAADLTPIELDQSLTQKLNEKYLENPDVSVGIKASVGRLVTVDGAVKKAGAYPVLGSLTLMQAVALAGGADPEAANLRRVAIFRKIGGRRQSAAFDLVSIRHGEAQDPPIFPGDVVIVDGSSIKEAQKQLFKAFPLLGIFRPY